MADALLEPDRTLLNGMTFGEHALATAIRPGRARCEIFGPVVIIQISDTEAEDVELAGLIE